MANYNELIGKVISNLDAIWTSLNTKGTVVSDATNGLTQVPVAKYSEIINQLTYIDGKDSVIDVAAFHAAETASGVNSIAAVYDAADAKFTISAKLTEDGYYEANSKLSGTLTAATVDLTGNTSWILADNKYALVASNAVIGKVVANKGTVTNSAVTLFEGTFNEAGKSEKSLQTVTNVTLEAKADNSTTNVLVDNTSTFKIKVNAVGTTTGNVSGKVTNTVTEGYVTAADKAAEQKFTHEVESSAPGELVVGIKAGGIEIVNKGNSNPTASITGSIVKNSARTGKDDYEINSAIEGLNLGANITEGYVTAEGTDVTVGAVNATGGKKYIYRGAVGAQTVALTSDQLTVTAGSELTAATGKTLTIAVAENVSQKIVAEEGYITAAETGNVSVTGTKTVKIKEATASAKYKINSYSKDGSSSIFTEGAGAAGDYVLTITPNVTVVKDVTAGWLDSADNITSTGAAANSVASKTYSVAKGNVSVDGEASFDVTLTEREGDKDGQGTLTKIGDIFLNAAPSKGDYFTVDTAVGYNVTAGYVDAKSGTSSAQKFMAKAVIENVVGADGENYYEVKSGGYLPSGILKNISTVAPTMANVATTLTSSIVSASIATDKSKDDYYEITVGKGNITAGYISSANGTLSGKGYVLKGSATLAPSATATPKGDITRVAENNTVKYVAKSTITASTGASITEGYITAATTDDSKAVSEYSYEINRATFGTTTHTTNASIAAADGIVAATGNDKKYSVTPRIDSCSTVFTVSNPGYISNTDTDILKFEEVGDHNGTMSAYYIHAGTGVTGITATTGTADINATNTFGTTTTGNYKVTVSGKAKANVTIDPGYYGVSEGTLNNVEIGVSKEVEIIHGKATVTLTGSNGISSTGVTLHDSDEHATKQFIAINANASVSGSPSSVTEGYMKSSDVTVTSNSFAASAVYVEKYIGEARSATNVAPTGTAQFEVEIGQTSETIETAADKVLATAETYNKKDIKISLSEHAMGSSVAAKLLELENRLAGVISTSSAS